MELTHLSWPFFDAPQRALAGAFADWAPARLAPFERDEGGDGRAARAIYRLLAHAGWLQATLPVPERSAIDLRSVCLLREISAFCSAAADVALSEPWLGILPIALHGSPQLQAHCLPRYLAGELLPAFALSEPGAGSDAAAITTRARRDGAHYVIDGRKTWTSNCGLADLYVVFAQTDEGICAFAVDGDAEGIVLEERLQVLPPHTVGTWALHAVRVPAERMIGAPGEGLRIALGVLALFRPSVAAASLGFARRALAEALARSQCRSAFGKPISEHQLIQAKLADMAVGIDASALLSYRAAWQHDSGTGPLERAAAIAKLHATETAFQVVDQALQIFGGLGVVQGETVERLFRHTRAFRIFDGTSEIQRLIIARDLLRGGLT